MKTQAIIPEELAGVRLDRVVRELFELPWSKARTRIQTGKISVNGRVCTHLDATWESGQTVLYTEDARRLSNREEFLPSCIVHLDTHVLVAHKPAGILTVQYDREGESFDKQLRTHLSRTQTKPGRKRGALPSLMVVHRLDKGTSGLLVFARTWIAKENLSEQFREHTTTREYRALAHGTVRSETITSHLLPDRGDGIRGSREHSPNHKLRKSGKGQRAVTHVTNLETVGGLSHVACRLETGRTNQIRIHLSEEGHPLLGETTYMRGFRGVEIPAERLMLHAATLGFAHPVSGEALVFEQSPPSDFMQTLRAARGGAPQ